MKSAKRPRVVAFDVIETLFSLEPLRPKMVALGLAPTDLELWFARLLRDAFALSVTEKYAPFSELARGGLQALLAQSGHEASDDELQSVLQTLGELPAQADVRAAFELLRENNVRITTVSNGAKNQTEKLLAAANLSEFVERVLSTDEVQRFKPHRAVYEYTIAAASVAPAEIALVAAHGWDIHGAACAGLTTGWVMRGEKLMSPAFESPDVSGASLVEVVERLLALP